MHAPYPDRLRWALIVVPAMLATTMVAVDVTIANVALPHMQSSLSASQDQIVWVLTSYIVASAIATPLSGWLASRYGRKLVMVVSVAGFTLASALCGAAADLPTMVVARLCQGACGAALVPLSQATLLDITPPEGLGKAMAIFSIGSMVGPIVGPTLGGWLTDTLSWRWVFFINVPVGVLSMVGLLAFMTENRGADPPRFDTFGFGFVSIALGSMQLMLDRGEQLDWFSSGEIQLYAAIFALATWIAVVHHATARDTFLKPGLFRDRNFAIGSAISATIGIVTFASLPLLTVMTQSLLGYSAFHTGIVGIPRVLGSVVAMIIVTRLVSRIDSRTILITGLAMNGLSMALYAMIDLGVDERAIVLIGLVQGFSTGLLFVPLSLIVFSTLPNTLRNEGAAMYALTRNLGNAIGISLLQREVIHTSAQSRSVLSEHVRPDSPIVQYARPDLDFASTEAMARMSAEIARQASMVGYIHVYWLTAILSLAVLPLVLAMRSSRKSERPDPLVIVE